MMNQLIEAVLSHPEERTVLQQLLNQLSASDQRYFLRNEITHAFAAYGHETNKPAYFFHSSLIGNFIHYTHEILLEPDRVWLVMRPWIGSQEIWCLDSGLTTCQAMTPKALLEARDRLVNRVQIPIFEIDVTPFYEDAARIDDPRQIGQGLTFLNRYLCAQVLNDRDYWLNTMFEVLHHREYDGVPLLINDRIASGEELEKKIREAIAIVNARPAEESYSAIRDKLQDIGFEPGWGNTAARVRETLELLDQLIHTPQPAILEAFVARFPAVFRVALISIHGWVGQAHVLGRSETLGQVAYVLEQARNLDQKLREEIQLAGLDALNINPQIVILTRLIPNCEGTACDLRLEKVDDTENTWILRVPFREFNPKITDNWMSRYDIWPYLETYAIDAEAQLVDQLKGRPDLIVGNYSDGNLVASMMARRLGVTHCNIAHSLEKPKHLFSNLYWQDLEPQYHFSAQFTADLISMNAADFIITSSYQEIVGTPETLGQYESYKHFTMPQLYHVINGVDLFSSKFNCVPPGIDERVFFPYTDLDRRPIEHRAKVNAMLFEEDAPDVLGKLSDPGAIPLLAVSPLSSVKNISGLVEFFGRSEAIRQRCNLILVTSKLNTDQATNANEAEEIEKVHQLIDQYQLSDRVRWIGKRLASEDLGEVYRSIADRHGVFMHFARFEAFGRVLLEAMISGLPAFATEFGGATEIVEDQKHGFLINPTDFDATTQKLLNFLNRPPEVWEEMSAQAVYRIHGEYNWQRHTQQLLLLTKLYSFWNYVHRDRREALLRYLEALLFLLYKPRADLILQEHMQH